MIVRDLGEFEYRGLPWDHDSQVEKSEKWASSSATSIGTEENLLGVPKAQGRALIYMRKDKQSPKRQNTSIKRHVTAE